MLDGNEILKALELAVVAYVFCCILMSEGMLFEWYSDLLDDLERANKKATWITKPLGNCNLCFSGQLALWTSLSMNLKELIIFICITILFTNIITLSIKKLRQ